MKFRITDGAAAPLILLAVSVRIVAGVAIDLPDLYCAGWLSSLLGGLLVLPMAFCVAALRSGDHDAPLTRLTEGQGALPFRALALLLALSAAFDGATVARGIAHSAGYIALGSTSLQTLLIPQLLLCLYCLRENGEAIGSAARLWCRVLPFLLLIVVLLEVKKYQIAWLTPVLGSGVGSVLDGAVRIAGWLSMMLGILLISEKDPSHPRRNLHPILLTLLCSALAAGLILLRNLMTPPLVYGDLTSRYFQFDVLLSNGRAPLTLQFPMIMLWLISLFMLLLFDSFTCVALLQRAIPKLGKWSGILIGLLLIAAPALFGLGTKGDSLRCAEWLFAAQSVILLAIMLRFGKKEGVFHA